MLSFKQYLKEFVPAALLTPTINPSTKSPISAGVLQKRKRDNQKRIGVQPTDKEAKEISGPEIFR